MSDFFGVTASSGARIKKGKEEEVEKLLEKYDFSLGLECQIDNGSIEIYGDVWPLWLTLKNYKDVQPCIDYFEEFLEELAPFLAEALVIQAIGNEKCIFPLAAIEFRVTSRSVVRRDGFKWSH